MRHFCRSRIAPAEQPAEDGIVKEDHAFNSSEGEDVLSRSTEESNTTREDMSHEGM
jgi:hypothetical protein